MSEHVTGASAHVRRMPPLGLLVIAGVFSLVLLGAGARFLLDRAGADGVKPPPSSAAADTGTKQELSRAYARLPLRFEPNRGQTDPRVKFLSRGPGYSLFLTPREAVLALTTPKARGPVAAVPGRPHRNEKGAGAVVRMRAVGANPKPRVTAAQRLGGQSNYLRGSDPGKWSAGVPGYGRVSYRDIYPGVDLVYHGDRGSLEYDFVLAPGADPRAIALSFAGQRRLWIDRRGELVLDTAAGKVRQARPFIYQQVGKHRRAIPGGYSLQGKDRVGFKVGAYDHSRPLVIDPTLTYSTYLGGAGGEEGYDEAFDIAIDASGSAYVTGATASSDFPTNNAFQMTGGDASDAFVTKFKPAGSELEYSSYLGGNGPDEGVGIAVDSSGSPHVTGMTSSSNFPMKNPFQPAATPVGDAFVTKLNPAGSALEYSTYLGGRKFFGSEAGGAIDRGNDIAVDPSGSTYVTGITRSDDFPTKNAFQSTPGNGDAFVAKLDPSKSADQSLVYSTLLGAPDNVGLDSDIGTGIAVDASGSAYVTGLTYSLLFPTTVNAFQGIGGTSPPPGPNANAFVTKFTPSGSALAYSTYLGGRQGQDFGTGIAVDASGSAYVTGLTTAPDFPAKNAFQPTNRGGYSDAFVTKLVPSGSALDYSSYLGGTGQDSASAIALDGCGSPYIFGETGSGDFPARNAVQATSGGEEDAFVAKFAPAGSALEYSTYLGGTRRERGDFYSGGIAVDASGDAYVAGSTESADFPTHTPFQPALGGPIDAFVAALAPDTVCRTSELPSVSVSDTTVSEGHAGQVHATFTLSLSASPAQPVSVDYATADDTAIAPGDYASASGTVTFAAGETNKTVTVAVRGDQLDEPDERFLVNLSNAQGATVSDGQGVGTIADDDPPGGGLPPGGGGGGSPSGGQGAGNVPGVGGPAGGPGAGVPPLLRGPCANERRGTDGPDTLNGSEAGDRLLGMGGDDTVNGLQDADCLLGGAGADTLSGAEGDDQLQGEESRDVLAGGQGDDRLIGGAGNDRLTGDKGADRLEGGPGDDRLSGGPGAPRRGGGNTYFGGAGNDNIVAANGRHEKVDCGKGRDRVRADRGDRLRGCEKVLRVRLERGRGSR